MSEVGRPAAKRAATDTDTPNNTASIAPAEPLSGIDRAIANASPWDVENFRAAIKARAARPGAFTIEDVLDDTGVPLDHQNRIGALTQVMARAGVIRRVSYTKARRASRAGGVVAVWVGAQW